MITTLKIQKEIELQIPLTPNFIMYANGVDKISIKDLDEDTLKKVAQAWTDKLLAKARTPEVL